MAPRNPVDALRVAAIQLCSRQDRELNLRRAVTLMDEAVTAGAQLVALPENLSFLGRDGDKPRYAEDPETGISDVTIHRMCVHDDRRMTVSFTRLRRLRMIGA